MHFVRRLPARASLLAEILAAYLRVRWLMARGDLPSTVAGLRTRAQRPPSSADGDPFLDGLRLSRATIRVLEALPTDSRCLMRSLVVSRLLGRRGIDSALVIGVRPGEEFGAHAWVEVNSRAVLEPGDGSFARLVEL